jgi:dTDP-glucose 4,6-dehydratase
VIPTILAQCLAGETVKLGSLAPTRDFNYVSNTVDAFLRCAELPAAVGKTINVGSGSEISVGDLVKKIGKLLGREIRIKREQGRSRPAKSEVERLVADNSLALKVLKWKPKVTLDEGLLKTAEWIQANQNEYRKNFYSI